MSFLAVPILLLVGWWSSAMDTFREIVAVIFGGLVLWLGVLLFRWIRGGFTFDSRHGRRR